MPGMVRTVADERDGLLAYLEQQRAALRYAARGLTDEQANQRTTVSALCVGGLIKHLARVERNWTVRVLAQQQAPDLIEAEQDWQSGFRLGTGETLAHWLDRYAEVAAETERIVRGLPSMDYLVPVPQGVPWFPKDVKEWSARWVLLHVIEETARHAGHADIVREGIDGSQAMMLMAQAEGWADQLAAWLMPAP